MPWVSRTCYIPNLLETCFKNQSVPAVKSNEGSYCALVVDSDCFGVVYLIMRGKDVQDAIEETDDGQLYGNIF